MVPQLQLQYCQLSSLRILFGLFIYLFAALTTHTLLAQQPNKQIIKGEQPLLPDSTISNILLNKTIPEKMIPIFLWGIIAYPELHDFTITIKIKNLRSALDEITQRIQSKYF